MSAAYVLKILRGAVAFVMPISASFAVGSLTGSTTPLVAPRARTECARSAAEAPQGDTPGFVSARVPAGTAVAISAVVPNAARVAGPVAPSGEPALDAPHLPLPSPAAIMTRDDSIEVPKPRLDRALGQVLDIVHLYGGNALSVGRGDPIPPPEGRARGASQLAPPSHEALADLVIEVPRDRLGCAIAELDSSAIGKPTRNGVCLIEVSKEVVDLEGRLQNQHAPGVIRLRLVPKGKTVGDTITGTHDLAQVQREIREITTPPPQGSGEHPVALPVPCRGEPDPR